jgi:hypothetical protein
LVAAVLGLIALQERDEATQQRKEAIEQRNEAARQSNLVLTRQLTQLATQSEPSRNKDDELLDAI